jgi:hypothetical protein
VENYEVLHEDSAEILDIAILAIKNLWGERNLIGTYAYILLTCGLLSYPIPQELSWIARHETALSVYIDRFVGMLDENIIIDYGDDTEAEIPTDLSSNSNMGGVDYEE